VSFCRAEGRWRSGIAACDVCGHEWAAVAPVGVEALECPNCGAMAGAYVEGAPGDLA
jgi:hypothetical protein